MNNLERRLLELTFPSVDIDALMEVIVATPNSRVATEILCDVYTEPDFVDKIGSSDILQRFVSYDKWSEEVSYKYEEPETVYCYFPHTVKKENITTENYEALSCSYNSNDDSYRHGVKTGKMKTCTSTASLKDWNRKKDAYMLADVVSDANVMASF